MRAHTAVAISAVVLCAFARVSAGDEARAERNREARAAISDNVAALVAIRDLTGVSLRADVLRDYERGAHACLAAIDAALEAGAPVDEPFLLHDGDDERLTLGEGRALCAELAELTGPVIATAAEQAAVAHAAALRTRYVALGISGDRLGFLIGKDSQVLRGWDCRPLDMARKRMASTIFEVHESATHWLVVRHELHGNRWVRSWDRRIAKKIGTTVRCR